MYLRIHVETKFRELHFGGHSVLHAICEFYLSDHGPQPQFSQSSILARSKAKIKNRKIKNCIFKYMYQSPSGPLVAGLPLKNFSEERETQFHSRPLHWKITFSSSNKIIKKKKTKRPLSNFTLSRLVQEKLT